MTNQHETNPKVRSWRPRISIANLLMLITCIGLGFHNWRTYQQSEVIQKRAHELDRENQRLRDEYGEFVVDDPSLFYGAQINRIFTSESRMLDWKWRIYTPTPYTIHFTDKNVSKIGYPKPDISRVIPSGYHTVHLHYVPDTYKGGPGWMTKINIKRVYGSNTLAMRANSSDWPPRLTSANAPWPHTVPEEGIDWGTIGERLGNDYGP